MSSSSSSVSRTLTNILNGTGEFALTQLSNTRTRGTHWRWRMMLEELATVNWLDLIRTLHYKDPDRQAADSSHHHPKPKFPIHFFGAITSTILIVWSSISLSSPIFIIIVTRDNRLQSKWPATTHFFCSFQAGSGWGVQIHNLST